MADAKVIVSAENRLKQGLDDAKKDLLGFGDAAEAIGNKLKNALTVTAIVVGLEKLGKAAFDCFVEFGEGERRIKQLKIALDNNETSFNRATRLIDEMREMSLASKDEIEGLVAELAALGKSDEEIDKITRAAVNLSNVTGQDLNSAFTLINGTYSGTAGKLEKLIPELADLTKEQLAAGGAADIINGKFGEMSKQLAEDNIPQKIKNIQDSWGDLKENLGEAVAPLFNPILEGINQIITGWNKAAEAADLHYKVLRATSFTEKISLTQNLKQNAQERLRLWDQSNSATVERIQKNINSPYIDPSAKRAAQDALATLMAQRDAIVTEINTYAATITDLNKQWTQTPASLLNPRDLIKPVDLLGIPRGTTGGASTSGGGVSESAPSSLASDIPFTDSWARHYGAAYQSWFENRPETSLASDIPFTDSWTRSYEAAAKLWLEGIDDLAQLERAYSILGTPVYGQSGIVPPVLGAGGKSIAEQIAEIMAPELAAMEEEFRSRPPTYGESTVTQFGGRVFVPRSDFAEQIAEGIGKIDEYLSDAADALSPADSAWSKRYQAAYDAWDEQIQQIQLGAAYTTMLMDNFELGTQDTVDAFNAERENLRQIKEYWEQHPLTGADLERSQAMNVLGLRSTTQPLLTAIPALQRIETGLPTPPQWQPPMTQQEEAMGLAMNEKGAQYFIDQFNQKLLNPLDSFARHYTEAARQALTFTGGAVYGESGIVPSKLGAGGASIKDQIAAMQGGEGFFAWLKNSFDGTVQGLGISISGAFKSIKDTGLSGADILDGISSAFGGLLGAIQPLTQIIFSANPLFAALIPIVQAMVQTLQPVISSLLAPLMGILTIIGQTLGAVLAPVLKALSPIIELVGKAFVWLYNNVILPIANGLIWVFTAVQNAIAGVINAFTWLTGISVQYASYEDAKLQEIEYGDVVQAGANAAGATAAQSAQYRSQSITINIYQQSPVVGDNGMRQFAAMIRAEFEALAYYGT